MSELCHAVQKQAFSIVVLAGGQSRRMGRDKASLSWGQHNILGSLLHRLRTLSDDLLVVSNSVRTISDSVRQVPDLIPGRGPLSGIHAGLLSARHDLAFVTACDVPFLVPEIVPQLVQAVGVTDGSVAVYQEKIQPLFACYSKNCIAVIEQLLKNEQYRVKDFLQSIQWVPVVELAAFDERCFMNVNTEPDYEKAKEILVKSKLNL